MPSQSPTALRAARRPHIYRPSASMRSCKRRKDHLARGSMERHARLRPASTWARWACLASPLFGKGWWPVDSEPLASAHQAIHHLRRARRGHRKMTCMGGDARGALDVQPKYLTSSTSPPFISGSSSFTSCRTYTGCNHGRSQGRV